MSTASRPGVRHGTRRGPRTTRAGDPPPRHGPAVGSPPPPAPVPSEAPLQRKFSRRALIGGTGALGAGAALALSEPAEAPAATPSSWSRLAESLQGQLVLPGQREYLDRALPVALQYLQPSPTAIAVCASASDVQRCVAFARTNAVPFAIRGGGHSYSGYSTTTGLLIDAKGMHDVRYDPSSRTVTCGGGVVGAQVTAGLQPHGVYVPIGSCPGVGLAGFAQGGGLGWYAHRYGLGCDAVTEAEVVTAAGDRLTCNQRENADLFWAVRGGGGGNFGVVTGLTLATFPADGDVSVARVMWRGVDPGPLVGALQAAFADAPPSTTTQVELGATTSLYVGKPSTPQVQVTSHHFGPAAQLQSMLAPVVAQWAPRLSLITDMPFWQAHAFLEADTLPTTGLWYTKSSFSAGPLPDAALSALGDAVGNYPGSSVGDAGMAFTLWGGAATETAFCHRAPGVLTVLRTTWGRDDDPMLVQAGRDWTTQTYQALQPYALPESYQNWTDPELSDYLPAYYGANLPRLVRVKAAVDPQNLFRFPQSIPVALPG